MPANVPLAKSYPAYEAARTLSLPATSPVHLPPPPPFDGSDPSALRPFLYKATAVVASSPAHFKYSQQQVTYLSTFLAGDALKWFVDLLDRNAEEYLPVENARRRLAAQELLPKYKNAFYWTSYPFVIAELETYAGFVQALEERFGEVECF